MRDKTHRTFVLSLLIALGLAAAIGVPLASGQIAANPGTAAEAGWAVKSDKRSHPLGDRALDLRMQAAQAKAKGAAVDDDGVMEVAKDTFVDFELEADDIVWTVPGEFADYPHNSIPEPDRTVDNSTIWVADFSREYYLEMLFGTGADDVSVRNYFLEQSSGRYAVHGDVTEWVPCPGNAEDYDDGDPGPGDAEHVWQFLEDSLDGWYAMQTMSPGEINAYLADYDVYDRYDYDHDGDFDEPDGYIDHFQSLHSGEGNEAGGGELGDDAIWSHSWYARYGDIGDTGPAFNLMGGIQIGESDYWIGDYTIQPENGGVGVFAHEFTHDLGAPDLYDLGGGDNAVAFWSVMDSGSWLTENDYDIGSKPDHLGAWEKLFLGWLDYDVATAGTASTHVLGPAEFTSTKAAQALLVTLPEKFVEWDIGEPYAGDYFFYSGSGNYLDSWMYRGVTLEAGATLTAMVRYEIENDWDYAYLVVSTDGGASWQNVETNLSTTTSPNDQNFGFGITGSSGGDWVELSADLSAYTGDVLLGFRYWTDMAAVEIGFMVDEIAVSGMDIDGGETETGWTYDGFKRTTGYESDYYANYYLAEYRTYLGWDNTLRVGPYNWGWDPNQRLVNWLEHFPYQDGLLIWYWDTSQVDNDASAHPGSGMVLPIDAHPQAMLRFDRKPWRNRIQSFDSTFGLEPTDSFTLHYRGRPAVIPSLPATPVFDDRLSYWDAANPTGSVITPVSGTQIKVAKVSRDKLTMAVKVVPVPVD